MKLTHNNMLTLRSCIRVRGHVPLSCAMFRVMSTVFILAKLWSNVSRSSELPRLSATCGTLVCVCICPWNYHHDKLGTYLIPWRDRTKLFICESLTTLICTSKCADCRAAQNGGFYDLQVKWNFWKFVSIGGHDGIWGNLVLLPH